MSSAPGPPHQKNLAHHDILLQYWHTLYPCGHTFCSDTLLVVSWHTTNTPFFVNILLYSLRHTLSLLIYYMIYVDIHLKVCRQESLCWDTNSKVDILSSIMLTDFLNVFLYWTYSICCDILLDVVDIHVKVCRQELICWDTISKVDILSSIMLTDFLNVFLYWTYSICCDILLDVVDILFSAVKYVFFLTYFCKCFDILLIIFWHAQLIITVY
jgi:hypothetical protein